jgi:hypothetical protein
MDLFQSKIILFVKFTSFKDIFYIWEVEGDLLFAAWGERVSPYKWMLTGMRIYFYNSNADIFW